MVTDNGKSQTDKSLDCDVEVAGVQAQPAQAEVSLFTTTTPSSIEPEMEIIPRSERRGLMGRFSLIPEVVRPRTYKNQTKWLMTLIVSFAAITSSTGSSIFYRKYPPYNTHPDINIDHVTAALSEVAHDLHTTPTVANLSLAFYMLSMAFTPMWWYANSHEI